MKARKARSALKSIRNLARLDQVWLALTFAVCASLVPVAPVRSAPTVRHPPSGIREATERAQYQARLQEVLKDKAGYAASIVAHWESEAKAHGRWDTNYASDLFRALMRLGPENLLAVGDATSFAEMMDALGGRSAGAVDHA